MQGRVERPRQKLAGLSAAGVVECLLIPASMALGCNSRAARTPEADSPAGSSVGGQVPAAHVVSPAPSAVELAPRARAKVFFSGHSLLDNPMPDWIESIAESRGDELDWEEQIVIGSPLRVRTRGDNAGASSWPGYRLGKNRDASSIDVLAELRSPTRLAPGEKYDTLLVAERNDPLGCVLWEGTIGYLRHFHERLVQQNPAARTLLYQVWPSLEGKEPEHWLRFVRQELFVWECVASKVNLDLEASGGSGRVEVVPGGLAMTSLVERALAGGVPGVTGTPTERLEAIFTDSLHLTPAGTYFLSALHYAALFGKSPVGADAPALVPAAAVSTLQQVAWEAYSRYRASNAPWRHPMSECRRRIAADFCPAYLDYRGRSNDVGSCADWAKADSPFSSEPTPPLPGP